MHAPRHLYTSSLVYLLALSERRRRGRRRGGALVKRQQRRAPRKTLEGAAERQRLAHGDSRERPSFREIDVGAPPNRVNQ